jgi:glycosyltransferase involved in cell wall biosynthesis
MKIGVDARILTGSELRGMASYLMAVLNAWPDPEDSFVFFAEKPPETLQLKLFNSVEWRIIKSPKGSRIHIWDWCTLPRALGRERTDLFWSPANLCFPIRSVPQIVTIHDTLLQEYVVFKNRLDRIYFGFVQPFCSKYFVDDIITVSRFSAERIAHVFKFPRSRIHPVYNGTTKAFQGVPAKIINQKLREIGLWKKLFIYALGAESPWKNTLGLLNAFSIVHQILPDVHLVISGVQSRFAEKVKRECIMLNLTPNHVSVLGYVDDKIRDVLYSGARVFVYPSLFEGFGLPILEAMSKGVPVVASNAASIPEVTGHAAFLTDAADPRHLADAIITVLENGRLRQKLIQRGLQNIDRFTWAHCALCHHKIMRQVAK